MNYGVSLIVTFAINHQYFCNLLLVHDVKKLLKTGKKCKILWSLQGEEKILVKT